MCLKHSSCCLVVLVKYIRNNRTFLCTATKRQFISEVLCLFHCFFKTVGLSGDLKQQILPKRVFVLMNSLSSSSCQTVKPSMQLSRV